MYTGSSVPITEEYDVWLMKVLLLKCLYPEEFNSEFKRLPLKGGTWFWKRGVASENDGADKKSQEPKGGGKSVKVRHIPCGKHGKITELMEKLKPGVNSVKWPPHHIVKIKPGKGRG